MFPQPSHIYPDGTKSYRKPKDGELFQIMKHGLVDTVWQFDDMMTKWVNVTTTKHYNAASTPTHAVPAPNAYIHIDNMENEGGSRGYNGWNTPDKCECGSASVRHPGHSHWCKLYVKP